MISIFTVIISLIIILTLAAVAGMYIEKSGIINLSIEGFMTTGALVYAIVAGYMKQASSSNQFWILIIAGIATMVIGALYALVTIVFKANQTIAGIAINALTLAISLFMIRSSLNPNASGMKLDSKIDLFNSWWSFGQTSNDIGWIFNIVLLVGLPSITIMLLYLNHTKGGKMIKAVGENPHAAASLGIKVQLHQLKAIMISTFFTGIAGALFAQRSSVFFGSTQGVGFLAVALVIFGQWKPTIIAIGGILFGTLLGLSQVYIQIPLLAKSMPNEIIDLIPYAVSLGVLVFTSKTSKAPRALGIPYKNAGR